MTYNLRPLEFSRRTIKGRHIRQAVMGLLFAVATTTRPWAISNNVDDSWMAALLELSSRGFEHGKDIAWTYGPLGIAFSKASAGTGFLLAIWADLILKMLAWSICLQAVAGFSLMPKVGFVISMLFAGVLAPDAFFICMCALSAIWACRERLSQYSFLCIALLWAALLISKATLAAAALLCTALVMGYFLATRRNSHAFGIVASFSIGVVVLWTMLGQNIAWLPAYFSNFIDLASGYADAMQTDATLRATLAVWVGLGILILGLALALPLLDATNAARVVITTLLIAISFLAWKQGTTRGSTHSLNFLLAASAALFLSAGLIRSVSEFERRRIIVIVLAGALLALSPVATAGSAFISGAKTLASNILNTPSAILSPSSYEVSLRATVKAYAEAVEAWRLNDLVDGGAVDVINFELARTIVAPLNYYPRPILQSYAAYTLKLAELNVNAVRSRSFPTYFLLDGKGGITAGQDSLLWLDLLTVGRHVGVHQGLPIIRHPGCGTGAELVHARSVTIGSGESVSIDSKAVIAARVTARLTLSACSSRRCIKCPASDSP